MTAAHSTSVTQKLVKIQELKLPQASSTPEDGRQLFLTVSASKARNHPSDEENREGRLQSPAKYVVQQTQLACRIRRSKLLRPLRIAHPSDNIDAIPIREDQTRFNRTDRNWNIRPTFRLNHTAR